MTTDKILEDLGSALNSLNRHFGDSNIIEKAISLTVDGIASVLSLDSALTRLSQTTGMTARELEAFYETSNEMARQLGVSTSQIIDQATAWTQLGVSSQEAAAKLAGLSSRFAAISPGMDAETALSSLAAVIQAYGVDTDQVLDGVLSKVNEVADRFRISNTEIAQGLEQSAAAMAEAGFSLEQNIALFAAGQENIDNALLVGNALQTVAGHMQGYNRQTGKMSAELTDLNIRIMELTKDATFNGRGISLFTDDSRTQCRDLMTYLEEISRVWDRLDQKTQNAVSGQLFGSGNAQAGAAILSNFGTVSASMDTMARSAGSASQAMASAMDTMDYKLARLSEAGTGIAQNLFQQKDLQSVVDILNSFLGVLDRVTEKLGLLRTLGVGVGLLAGIKNVGSLKMFRLRIV